MAIRNKPRDAAVFGIDLGKNLFHVCGLDAAGIPVQRATFRNPPARATAVTGLIS